MVRLLVRIFSLIFIVIPIQAQSFVQCQANEWASGSSFTTTITATTGNMLAVGTTFSIIDGSGDILSNTDGTNTYTIIDSARDLIGGVSQGLYTFYSKNITGGALTVTTTINETPPGGSTILTGVCEISGADSSFPLDKHTINTQNSPGTGTDILTSGNVTTVANGEYIFGVTAPNGGGNISVGTGFTARTGDDSGFIEDKIQMTLGTVSATFTDSSNPVKQVTAIATFTGSGTSPTSSGSGLFLQQVAP